MDTVPFAPTYRASAKGVLNVRRLWIILSLWIALASTGCATAGPKPISPVPTIMPTTPAAAYGKAEPLVSSAIDDLASRLGLGKNQVNVVEVTETAFPDASLGVPEQGKVYAQVVTPGYVIRLTADDQTYEYHASKNRIVLASANPTPATPQGETLSALVEIQQVQVDENRVLVSGTADLPDGACVETELLAVGNRQEWWPTDRCATVQNHRWQIEVQLG